MGHHRSEPPRSSGRALIGSGIGLIVFAAVGAVSLTTGSDVPISLRSALSPLVAVLGVPVGIGLIVGGIAKIRRGHR
ncbi:ACR3 family arsenite efflux pump ArsB [Agrococcus sp. UYP33]